MQRNTFTGFLLALCLSVTAAAALSVATVSAAAGNSQSESIKLLFISDLHLDIFWGTANASSRGNCFSMPDPPILGKFGCDSSQTLINHAARNAASDNADAQFIVVTGDLIRHDGEELTLPQQVDTVQRVINEFAQVWGPRTIVAAKPMLADILANNDAIKDYYYQASSSDNPILSAIASHLQLKNFFTANESKQFAKCGYYKKTLDVGATIPLTVIGFNSLLWDVELDPPLTPEQEADPCGQMAFMSAALADARRAGHAVLTMSHIPPGINLFDGVKAREKNVWAENLEFYWFDRYSNGFKNLLKEYQDVIRLAVFAHTHHLGFIADFDTGVPVLIQGAISPIYFNRPMYSTMLFDSRTLIPDWSTFRQIALSNFSTNAVWAETRPSLAEMMGMPRAVSGDVAGPQLQLAKPYAEMRSTYFRPYYERVCREENSSLAWFSYSAAHGSVSKTCDDKCRGMLFCYATQLTRQDQIKCIQSGSCSYVSPSSSSGDSSSSTAEKVGFGVAIVVGVIIIMALAFRVFEKRRSLSMKQRTPLVAASSIAEAGSGGGVLTRSTADDTVSLRSEPGETTALQERPKDAGFV